MITLKDFVPKSKTLLVFPIKEQKFEREYASTWIGKVVKSSEDFPIFINKGDLDGEDWKKLITPRSQNEDDTYQEGDVIIYTSKNIFTLDGVDYHLVNKWGVSGKFNNGEK